MGVSLINNFDCQAWDAFGEFTQVDNIGEIDLRPLILRQLGDSGASPISGYTSPFQEFGQGTYVRGRIARPERTGK